MKWKPFDRSLTESELNYRHRAKEPSDWELDGSAEDRGMVPLLPSLATQDERPASGFRERGRSDAPKGLEEAWFQQRIGRGEELP